MLLPDRSRAQEGGKAERIVEGKKRAGVNIDDVCEVPWGS